MRQVLLCSAVLAVTACIGMTPAKAVPQTKEGWSRTAGLVETVGWRRYHRGYYARVRGYYPPPYIFYPPPRPYMSPRFGYDLPYHYRYYPPY
jgi:hypothetical protein